MNERIKDIVYVAMFVALTSVCAMITIPFGPVPFTLQTFAFTLILFCAKPNIGFASILLYVALGCIGAPIFSGMKGGIGCLLGPTGGFLIGYVLAIYPIGIIKKRLVSKISNKVLLNALLLLIAFLMTCIAYLCGCFQYAVIAGVSIEAAFLVAVLPFIIVDVVKICVALALSNVLEKHLS